MTLTSFDMQAFLNQLAEQPQARNQLRVLLLSDALHTLPERFDQLTVVVTQLAEAQQRGEERLARLETTVQALVEAQQRTEVRLEQLAEAQQRTEARLEQLAEAQQRTEVRLEQLAEAQQRAEGRLTRLETTVQALVEGQQQLQTSVQALSDEVRRLVSWQRGEAGRRNGERFERLMVRRGPALFNGGEGGATDQPAVQIRLTPLLLSVLDEELPDEENPFLADLIWWKGDQFVVVEASQQVDGGDVRRAERRAETLQRAGVQAIAMVFGEQWMADDTREMAEARSVQWKVGDDLSPGFLAFRRLPATAQNGSS